LIYCVFLAWTSPARRARPGVMVGGLATVLSI
jgi:hypothetical protein